MTPYRKAQELIDNSSLPREKKTVVRERLDAVLDLLSEGSGSEQKILHKAVEEASSIIEGTTLER